MLCAFGGGCAAAAAKHLVCVGKKLHSQQLSRMFSVSVRIFCETRRAQRAASAGGLEKNISIMDGGHGTQNRNAQSHTTYYRYSRGDEKMSKFEI